MEAPTMVNIPNFSKSQIIKVESDQGVEEITISEYQAIDTELVEKIMAYQVKLPGLMMKVNALEGYRNKLQSKLVKVGNVGEEELEKIMMETASEIDDSKFTKKDVQDIENMAEEAAKMKGDLTLLTWKLGQRGLKRFYYQDEPEYLEAERTNQATKFIDAQKDIKFSVDTMGEIAMIMINLGKAPKKLQRKLEKKAAGKGK